MCLNKPKYLTFKNVTLLANSKDVKRGVVLHNVDLSKLKIPVMFSLTVLTETKEYGVVGAGTGDFE